MKAPVERVWFTGEAMSRDYYGFLQVKIYTYLKDGKKQSLIKPYVK
jgi:hypothetical protein